MEGINKHIPNFLRKYRRSRGLSQKEVAEILGLKSTSMISRWEKGFCLPNTLNLFKLTVLYRTPADAFFRDLLKALRNEINKREEVLAKRPKEN